MRLIFSKFFWINIAIAIAVCFLLLFATLQILKIGTHHGEQIEVPQLEGKNPSEAEVELQGTKLTCVVNDSVFDRKRKPGEITEQYPAAGTMVKSGRVIYLTVNARAKRMIRLPELRNISEREAKLKLKQLNLTCGEVVYVPSEYNDLVMDMKFRGQSIDAGEQVADGSEIVLEVGKSGVSDAIVIVPSLIGLSMQEAMEKIHECSLVIGGKSYDVEPNGDEMLYKVYYQSLKAGTSTNAGSRINIMLSRDSNKRHSEQSEEVFW